MILSSITVAKLIFCNMGFMDPGAHNDCVKGSIIVASLIKGLAG